MDYENKGYITRHDMSAYLQSNNFEEIRNRKKQKDDILEDLFDHMTFTQGGHLTMQEWLNFYTDVR